MNAAEEAKKLVPSLEASAILIIQCLNYYRYRESIAVFFVALACALLSLNAVDASGLASYLYINHASPPLSCGLFSLDQDPERFSEDDLQNILNELLSFRDFQ